MKKESDKIEKETEPISEVIKEQAESKQNESFLNLDKKIDKMGADLKSVIDKIDSFEIDTDEVLENVSYETNDKKDNKKGIIALGIVLIVLVAFAFKDKIANAVTKNS